MLEPQVEDTSEWLVVSRSPWLRLLSALAFVFFFCCTVLALASPFFTIVSGYARLNWGVSLGIAAFTFLPTCLFWYGSQSLELRLCFNEGYYEMRRGFRRFTHASRGRFSDINHLTIWNKQENRYDVSYTISLTWNNGRLPFTLRVFSNSQQEAVDWADTVAQRLNVPLNNRVRA